MFPGEHAAIDPDKRAAVDSATGDWLSYGAMDRRAAALARRLRALGCRPGDSMAIISENSLDIFPVVWAGLGSGLYVTPVNWHLTEAEIAYVLQDCGARVVFASENLREATARALENIVSRPQLLDLACDADAPSEAGGLDGDGPLGQFMFYSSGTTGRPKGVRRPLSGRRLRDGDASLIGLVGGRVGVTRDAMYLSPAPLHHAAPIAWTATVQALGGTVVMMPRFEPVAALRAMDEHAVTHAQFVPTMFVRMLKLSEDDRSSFSGAKLEVVAHAAAPCPPEVKRQMIGWWGPILVEYYAGSEGNGVTMIDSGAWLDHPGSVGTPLSGGVHVCDPSGAEVATGSTGLVYFEPDREAVPFEYWGDAEKTAAAAHPHHAAWSTLGDIGHVDGDGYLYLTDRRTNTVIVGGVNIYPREIEDVLILHPLVLDVAVFGVPHDEMGEELKAAVQLVEGAAVDTETEADLLAYCRERLPKFKCPKSVDFLHTLPRSDTGKLYTRLLRDPYWEHRERSI